MYSKLLWTIESKTVAGLGKKIEKSLQIEHFRDCRALTFTMSSGWMSNIVANPCNYWSNYWIC